MPGWPQMLGVIRRDINWEFKRLLLIWTNIFAWKYLENVIFLLARGCSLTGIECHRLGIVMEHRNLATKLQVSAVQIKNNSNILVSKFILRQNVEKTLKCDKIFQKGIIRSWYIVPCWLQLLGVIRRSAIFSLSLNDRF